MRGDGAHDAGRRSVRGPVTKATEDWKLAGRDEA